MIHTYSKIILYLLEYRFIRLVATVLRWPLAPLPQLTKDQKRDIDAAFKALLVRWKFVMRNFPDSNTFSNPIHHIKRFKLVLQDLKAFLSRKDRKDSHDLKNTPMLNSPEYFKRNYHYQTDGYFTFDSAARYDHQIELLFLGTAHIMRKSSYSILKNVLKDKAKVLEFGAGSGTSGFQFKQLYPQSQLDLLEPGKAYLDYAQEIYPISFNQVFPEFMENFKPTKKYDCIFSCFVMHEIPVSVWDSVTQTIKSSLASDGHLLIIDSQQNCDKTEHQFALDQFGEDFYEPYFPEFRENSLEEYFTKQGFKLVAKEEVLFSKALLFTL